MTEALRNRLARRAALCQVRGVQVEERWQTIYQVPIPGKEPGTVFDCQKTGYRIKDRVLRAAQVGVVQDTQS